MYRENGQLWIIWIMWKLKKKGYTLRVGDVDVDDRVLVEAQKIKVLRSKSV